MKRKAHAQLSNLSECSLFEGLSTNRSLQVDRSDCRRDNV